jgi:HlyD family secretion protein
MNWKWVVGIAVVLGAAAVIVQANATRNIADFGFKWQVGAEAPTPVTLEPAATCNIVQTVAAPGEVEAEFKVEISSQVLGRIERMPAKGDSAETYAGQLREGDPVKKGQVVVVLDSRIYRERLRQNDALAKKIDRSLAGLRADVEKAKRDFERNKSLVRTGAVGSADVADMETMLKVKESQLTSALEDLEAATANSAQAKRDLEECTVRAPMDGVISKLSAEEGENVVVGTMNNAGTVIMTISDMNSIIVRARIDENYVPLVKPGQLVRIYLQYDNEQPVMGRVKRVSPQGEKGAGGKNSVQTTADPNELAKFETLISIDDPPPIVRLGMTANVEIVVEEKSNVLGIPPQAVLQRRAKDLPPELTANLAKTAVKKKGFEDPAKRWHQVVFVDDNGKAKLKVVETGVSDENRVEILNFGQNPGALQEGEKVIVGPFRAFDKLKDGKPITPFVETPDGKGRKS